MCTAITRRLAGLARETRRLRARQPVSRDDPRSARSFYRGFVIRSPARGLARFLWKERSSADGGRGSSRHAQCSVAVSIITGGPARTSWFRGTRRRTLQPAPRERLINLSDYLPARSILRRLDTPTIFIPINHSTAPTAFGRVVLAADDGTVNPLDV